MGDISCHLPYLMEQALPAGNVLELGTRGGCSTSAFLLAKLELENGGKVISVDPEIQCETWVKERVGDRLIKWWTFICGSSVDEAIIEKIKPYGPFSLVFIDSSHEAAQTTIELETYSQMLAPGGKIVLHDTEEANVYWNEGVRKPMLKFLALHPEFQIEREVTVSHGLTTLRKRA